jgi:branched-chain amino acid transport system permease protein
MSRSSYIGYGVFAAVLLAVPAIFTRVPFYTMSTAVLMGLFAIGALGLVPLTGHARQISFGQAAFYGIGGYASAILTTRWHLSPILGLLAGMALAAAVAWLLGLAIFRVQGHYLALATLGIDIALTYLANQLPFTGRNAGITDVPPLGAAFGTDLSMYYLVAGVLLVSVVAVDRLLRSDLGKLLTAAGDSPVATAASGIDIAGLRRTAFTLAAVLAAVAGSLATHWYRYADPSMLSFLNSLQFVIIATVGGLRTVWGAPLGAFTVITLAEVSRQVAPLVLPNAGGEYELAVYGLALVGALLFLPNGVAGGLKDLVVRLARGNRRPAPEAGR